MAQPGTLKKYYSSFGELCTREAKKKNVRNLYKYLDGESCKWLVAMFEENTLNRD